MGFKMELEGKIIGETILGIGNCIVEGGGLRMGERKLKH